MTPADAPLALGPAALDRLFPMHLLVTASGHIRRAGPTLVKLAGRPLTGLRLAEAFELRRPRQVGSVAELGGLRDDRINVVLRGGERTVLKGLVCAVEGGEVLINLAFGITVVEAIGRHGLTAADFTPTDLTVEMLYLAEARAAVMAEALTLNARLKEAKRTAEALAMSDTLTGLGNRRALDEAMARMLAGRERFGLMQLDLDFFKDVNDTLGHAAGDRVLGEVARILRGVTRGQDVVARVGGDEFQVLFPGLTDPGQLTEIGSRVIAELERPVRFHKRTCRISGSIGICTTEMYQAPDARRMLADVDSALYASKHGGRAMVTVFDPAHGAPGAWTAG